MLASRHISRDHEDKLADGYDSLCGLAAATFAWSAWFRFSDAARQDSEPSKGLNDTPHLRSRLQQTTRFALNIYSVSMAPHRIQLRHVFLPDFNLTGMPCLIIVAAKGQSKAQQASGAGQQGNVDSFYKGLGTHERICRSMSPKECESKTEVFYAFRFKYSKVNGKHQMSIELLEAGPDKHLR
jgi:hypothetical protein